jgi:hypothetical protein
MGVGAVYPAAALGDGGHVGTALEQASLTSVAACASEPDEAQCARSARWFNDAIAGRSRKKSAFSTVPALACCRPAGTDIARNVRKTSRCVKNGTFSRYN